ncbi:MAG TPA: YggT family protein [Coriobacteriia bacterium]
MSLQLLLILERVVRFYEVLVFIYVLMSWFPMRGIFYDIYRVIASVVEPYVGIFRRFIPPIAGLDFSPWAAILVLEFVIFALAQLV